ncbi:MAG: hypothetical protein WHV66_14715, partial [Anaerolineales bacterium]
MLLLLSINNPNQFPNFVLAAFSLTNQKTTTTPALIINQIIAQRSPASRAASLNALNCGYALVQTSGFVLISNRPGTRPAASPGPLDRPVSLPSPHLGAAMLATRSPYAGNDPPHILRKAPDEALDVLQNIQRRILDQRGQVHPRD